jgi:hypothetical protein
MISSVECVNEIANSLRPPCFRRPVAEIASATANVAGPIKRDNERHIQKKYSEKDFRHNSDNVHNFSCLFL